MPHISLAAEKIGMIFFLPITNSLLTTWITMVFLIGATFIVTKQLRISPSGIQVVIEELIAGLYDLFKSVTGEHVDRFFPLLASFFLFILIGNWSGLLPGVGSIGIKEGHEVKATQEVYSGEIPKSEEKLIPLFRAPTADLNTTLALALIAVFSIQYFGFKLLGSRIYLGKFFNFKNPILFFVGLLELVSEFTKVISFTFRLFGNIFAGEVLLTVIAFLMPLITPLPFLGLEIFVGMIQALVFSMLTAVFLNIATAPEAH